MKISGISTKRIIRVGMVFALLLACLMGGMLIPKAFAAEKGEVMLTVVQAISGVSLPPEAIFSYRLTAKSASNPMPTGSGASGYLFDIAGTGEARIGPIRFAKAGLYTYEIHHVTDPRPGYVYDQTVYKLEILVESDLTATVIASKEDGSKAADIQYQHSYNYGPSDPGNMVDPPIVKTVSGNPSVASAFTFHLVPGNPSNPMPAGSVNGVKTVQVTGSGWTEFGTWAYTKEGTYYYTVSEVNTGTGDYVFDATVYTITDTVKAVDGQLVVNRVVMNNANKQVTSLSFINTYTGDNKVTPPPSGKPGGPTPTPPPSGKPGGTTPPPSGGLGGGGSGGGGSGGGGSGGSGGGSGAGPKTGDESQTTLYTVLFCIAGITALISVEYLLADRRRGKTVDGA